MREFANRGLQSLKETARKVGSLLAAIFKFDSLSPASVLEDNMLVIPSTFSKNVLHYTSLPYAGLR